MGDPRKLTSYSHGAGCACKLGPKELAEVMGGLELPAIPPAVLVGAETSDDAAVYLPPGGGPAVIATTDFFTPIVDDPQDWGRIAAANAVSDIYAMGGTPAFALNLVAWPVDELPLEMLGRVLAGGAKVAAEAGFAILGGHSITDPEPKYGMVVVGFADPDAIMRNSTARAGDRLLLTKPLGLGMISTAIKRGVAGSEQIRAAVDTMTTLNAAAAEAMVAAPGTSAATDVTGFGLLGHLREMLIASGLSATLDAAAPELLPGVLDLAQRDVVAGGTKRNHAFLQGFVDWGDLTAPEQLVLADAQTSGGLLIATGDVGALTAALTERGIPWSDVGVVEEGPPRIALRGRVRG
ncbi:MAG: selenide, water dikinase SelD [Actinomycetota bacterium]